MGCHVRTGRSGWSSSSGKPPAGVSRPDFFAALPAKYPRLAYWRMAGMHVYALNCAELMNGVHREHARVLTKSRALQEAKILLGNGLLTDKSKSRLQHRRMVQPAFHRDRIREYSERMVAATLEHEQGWQAGQQVDMVADMSGLTVGHRRPHLVRRRPAT